MQTYLIEMLECPDCHGELNWDITERQGDRIKTADVSCSACNAAYPILEGIGQFLTPDLPREDLWEQVESNLVQHLHQNPEIEAQLMDVPLETLTPADQFLRALVLEEWGEFARAKVSADLAQAGLYTPEYLACSESQIYYTIERLSTMEGPLVDLASGMGKLVQCMARQLSQPIVATDYSPRVLWRDRQRLEYFGLYDQVSLLAFDARRTPFKNGAVKTLTTYQGLANISEPGNLLSELRRIVSGSFLGISIFYSEDDKANNGVISELGLSDLCYARSALQNIVNAGWKIKGVNSCFGEARPTPMGVVIEGAAIDALPVVETTLEWSVILAE